MTAYYEGKLLVAPPTMRDWRFHKSIVYIWKHDVAGACGTIINRPLEQPVWSDVCEEARMASLSGINPTIYYGGPVMGAVIGCLHTLDYRIDSTNVGEHLGFTMDRQLINSIAHGQAPDDYIVTMGFASWDAGQLEEEMMALPPRSKHESWLPLEFDPNLVWHGENDELWNACVNLAVAQHSREFTSKLLRD
jgi:putative transcriptional regulator